MSRSNSTADSGVSSAGLTSRLPPAARAGASFALALKIGPFHGEDQAHHAVWLLERVRVHVDVGVGRDAVGLDVVGDAVDLRTPAGVVPEELRAGRHLQLRLHQRHAGVERVELGELLGVLVDQLADAPQDLGPLAARQVGPDAGLERGLRPRRGLVDRVFPAVGEFGDLFFRRGVDDRNDLPRAGAIAEVVQYCLQSHLFPSRSTLIEPGTPVPVMLSTCLAS